MIKVKSISSYSEFARCHAACFMCVTPNMHYYCDLLYNVDQFVDNLMDESIECCVARILCVILDFYFKREKNAANGNSSVIFTQARDIYTLCKFGTVHQTLTPFHPFFLTKT